MEKTIKIGNKSVRLDNNIGWAIAYRDQFGHDIIPSLMPMIAGAIDIFSGLLNETGKTDGITLSDIAKIADGDTFLNAAIHMGALEFVDFINITWALAKTADENIPEPKEWVKQFDTFSLDIVGPAVFSLIIKGVVSSKNLKRAKDQLKKIRPITESTSKQLSSPDLNEESL